MEVSVELLANDLLRSGRVLLVSVLPINSCRQPN